MPRLRGTGTYRIDYRHVIDALVTQAGRVCALPPTSADLFPSQPLPPGLRRARAHEERVGSSQDVPARCSHLAAGEGEAAVDAALATLLVEDEPITVEAVEAAVGRGTRPLAGAPW